MWAAGWVFDGGDGWVGLLVVRDWAGAGWRWGGGGMSASDRAWECAIVLIERDDLTVQQRIDCHIAVMAGPHCASAEVIALAAQILGERQ